MHTTDSGSEFTSTSVTQHFFFLFPTLIQQLKLTLENLPLAWLFQIDKTSSLLWKEWLKKVILKIVIIASKIVRISNNMTIVRRRKKSFLPLVQTYTEIICHVVLQNCLVEELNLLILEFSILRTSELIRGRVQRGILCAHMLSCWVSTLIQVL